MEIQKNEFGVEFFDHQVPLINNDFLPKVHHFRSSSISTITNDLSEHWSNIVEQGISIPASEFFVGGEEEIPTRVSTTFLGDDDLYTPSSTQNMVVQNDQELFEHEEEDLTDFEVYVPESDQADIDEEEFEINPTISVNIDSNTPCSSKDYSSNAVHSSSEANAIFIVLGGSSELSKYDKLKNLFKLGKASSQDINILQEFQAKFQQQVLQKVSLLETEFHTWERSFLANNNFCSPGQPDVVNNPHISSIFKKIRVGNQLLRSWNVSF